MYVLAEVHTSDESVMNLATSECLLPCDEVRELSECAEGTGEEEFGLFEGPAASPARLNGSTSSDSSKDSPPPE